MSFTVAVEAISPLTQNLDHGSYEDQIHHGCHGHRTSRHRRWDNSQLLGLHSYIMLTSETQTSWKKTHQQGPALCGVEHRDPAHKVVIHGNIHGDFGATHRRLSSAQWRGRPLLMCGCGRQRHAGAECTRQRHAGDGGGRLHARPCHFDFAPRVPNPGERPVFPWRVLMFSSHELIEM
jgi:hypothetical protein